jgi:hypothetical protein
MDDAWQPIRSNMNMIKKDVLIAPNIIMKIVNMLQLSS